ncbi:MAG: MBL fold metallo-hydrolase [Candidatus Margulisbacteria bacterium]|nr:MBL fold metallo-hydrolase [Candidatus Margulisiibacteriota bacterium]
MLKKLFCIATLAVIVTLSGCQSAQDVSTTTTSTSTTATSTTTTASTTSTTIAGDNFSVYFIDVGQGDSILIKTKDSHYVLIDSGPSDASNGLNTFLNSKGVASIYRAILTHTHADHYGEFKDVVGNYTISGFMFANYPNTNSTYVSLMNKLATSSIPTIEVKDGDSFTLDNLTFRFYHPPAGFISTSSDENDNSLAIKVSNQSGVDLLDCGDLETAGMSSLLSRHSGDVDIELLKVNHHGSSNGTNQALLTATTPTDAFICVGAGNSYGHPEAATLSLLSSNSINVYRTDSNGDITVNVNGGSYSVATEK